MTRFAQLFALAAVSLASGPAQAQGAATYRVTFESTWSAATHPDAFPANAHFSPLVGTAHDATVAFWTPGAAASAGIEEMAERGRTVLMVEEFAAAMGAASPGTVGPDVPVSPGTAEMTLVVSPAHPLVTLVTMIAPSPDWFVGVHGLDLRAGAGWAERVVVPLVVYDAGTDSGTDYSSLNLDTQPREPIAVLAVGPFASGAPVGHFTFERLTPAAIDDAPAVAAVALSAPAPNPASGTTRLVLTLAEAGPARVDVLDVLGRTLAVVADQAFPAGQTSVSVDTRGLATGIVIVRAQTAAGMVAQRLTVRR